jgi:hypothetical protein
MNSVDKTHQELLELMKRLSQGLTSIDNYGIQAITPSKSTEIKAKRAPAKTIPPKS